MIGKNDGNDEAIKVIVNDILSIDDVRKKYAKGVVINLNLDATKEQDVFELVRVLERNQGKCQCFLNISGSGLDNNSIYLSRKYTVEPSRQFMEDVKKLLGQDTVHLRG
jgi:DNA polymerase III alpha subunit